MRVLVRFLRFSAVHFVVGFAVAYALTGHVLMSVGIAFIQPVLQATILLAQGSHRPHHYIDGFLSA